MAPYHTRRLLKTLRSQAVPLAGAAFLALALAVIALSPRPFSSEAGFVAFSPNGASGGAIIPASCELGDYHDAPYFGQPCTSAPNACGQASSGTYQCGQVCSAGTPPNPAGYGSPCNSAPNSCGQVNTGTIQCNGSCSASTPSSASCTPSISCSVSPSSGYQGDPFTWSASASGGNSSFSYSWSGTDGLSGNTAQVVKSYSTTGTKNGTVTVTTGYGFSASCSAAINGVNGGPSPTVGACTAAVSPNSATIDQGQSVTIAWSPVSSHCGFTSCSFLDGGTFSASGSRSVSPSSSSTYGLTCTGTYGTSAPAYSTITVLVPTATISVSPQRVSSGGSTTVTWGATNVNVCNITRNGTAWKSNIQADRSRNVNGSSPDTITTQTTYVLTCQNNSAQAIAVTSTAVVNVVPGFTEF